MKQKDLVSLNSELLEFSVQELEERLETDPLSIGGLVDLSSTQDLSQSFQMLADCECNSCSWLAHNN